MESRPAKLFMNGASQAVRLPAEFRFSSDEVFISRDENTGDVVLSTRPGGRVWADYFAQLRSLTIPDAFMKSRELNKVSSARGVFDDVEDSPKKSATSPKLPTPPKTPTRAPSKRTLPKGTQSKRTQSKRITKTR
jgi:antitoxin VapB